MVICNFIFNQSRRSVWWWCGQQWCNDLFERLKYFYTGALTYISVSLCNLQHKDGDLNSARGPFEASWHTARKANHCWAWMNVDSLDKKSLMSYGNANTNGAKADQRWRGIQITLWGCHSGSVVKLLMVSVYWQQPYRTKTKEPVCQKKAREGSCLNLIFCKDESTIFVALR